MIRLAIKLISLAVHYRPEFQPVVDGFRHSSQVVDWDICCPTWHVGPGQMVRYLALVQSKAGLGLGSPHSLPDIQSPENSVSREKYVSNSNYVRYDSICSLVDRTPKILVDCEDLTRLIFWTFTFGPSEMTWLTHRWQLSDINRIPCWITLLPVPGHAVNALWLSRFFVTRVYEWLMPSRKRVGTFSVSSEGALGTPKRAENRK